MSQANTVLFLSDILHSNDLQHINITQNSHRSGDINLIICHRDDASLYKATRKISRTAQRLISTFSVDGIAVADRIGEDCTCCWIGNQDPLVRGKNDEAILRRLESEFGPSVSRQVSSFTCDFDDISKSIESKIKYLKFRSTKSEADTSEMQEPEPGGREELSILFVDLDGLAKTLLSKFAHKADSENQSGLHWELIENVLGSASQPGVDGSSVVHIKCDLLYHTVSSLLSSGGKTDLAKRNSYVIKSDIGKYLASKQSHSTIADENGRDSAASSQNVIRRLRQKKGAADCPLSLYSVRYIELASEGSSNDSTKILEICRFHNYDEERGCLRTKKARLHPHMKGCGMDHDHCHNCGKAGHRAFECSQLQAPAEDSSRQPMVFTTMQDGNAKLSPFSEYKECLSTERVYDVSAVSLPALLVLGGRLRGRTLASCEILPLHSSAHDDTSLKKCEWIKMPNLLEHRGSHAACSPMGTNLAFVMGGGGVDGNLDSVECYSFKEDNTGRRWETLTGRLPSPRHAFGSVACVTKQSANHDSMTVSLFAVGGWKYGSVSCESTERLTFEYPSDQIISAQWKVCAPLLKPRRLHSVAPTADGSSIYVFGGFVDKRFTTSSIERYDIASNRWYVCDKLPFSDNGPLVQAVPDWSSDDDCFLIFPFSSCENGKSYNEINVLRYKPGAASPFSLVYAPCEKEKSLRLPLKNWASFSATSSSTQQKAYLIGGTIDGKWTERGFELDLQTMKWTELPKMVCARRRLAAVVIE